MRRSNHQTNIGVAYVLKSGKDESQSTGPLFAATWSVRHVVQGCVEATHGTMEPSLAACSKSCSAVGANDVSTARSIGKHDGTYQRALWRRWREARRLVEVKDAMGVSVVMRVGC